MLATVLLGTLVVATVLLTAIGGALIDQRRVAAAADLGALAGASAVQRGAAGCASARVVVAVNSGRVASCWTDGEVVTVRAVRVTRPVLGLRFTVSSRARAGPAGLVPG